MKEKGVMRERSGSIGAIKKMWKRWRKQREEREEEEAFRSSKRTVKSSDKKKRLREEIRGDDKETT